MNTEVARRAPGIMHGHGAPAISEATLGWWLTIIACAVVVIVTAMLLVAVFRKRDEGDRGGDTKRRQPVAALSWIYVGVALTTVILLASFAGTLVTLAHASRPNARSPLTLDVTGHQWWWEVRYSDSLAGDGFVTANEVHIPVGVPVRLRFHGADVIHSWWIPELAGKTDLIPGQVNTSWFEAREPGEYRGQCAEYCGLEHAKMGAIVFADPPAQFARAGASSPTDSTTHTGSLVFERSCSACHTVRGTSAEGRVGPDLTHLASRTTIAAGLLPNTEGSLLGWIGNPQLEKPGALMPKIPLQPAEIAAVAAYLRTLR
jgi:cytochrome c oxidase subunit 2